MIKLRIKRNSSDSSAMTMSCKASLECNAELTLLWAIAIGSALSSIRNAHLGITPFCLLYADLLYSTLLLLYTYASSRLRV
ncbi:MAG: hypothetical protein JXR44_06030 [Thiotrichales bacterium]|nr:hypothetical protein [Thiotrichales bacterium]